MCKFLTHYLLILKMNILKPLAVFWLLAATPAISETVRQLDAHNHGEARLTIVIDKDQVALTLHTPSANIIGFEHRPKTEEQHAQADDAKTTLQYHTNLFAFDAQAECEPIESAVHWTFDEAADHTEEHEEHEEHATASHSEFEAEFHLSCDQVEQLTSIEVRLFALFPKIEKLHVEALFTDSHFAGTLSSNNNIISVN